MHQGGDKIRIQSPSQYSTIRIWSPTSNSEMDCHELKSINESINQQLEAIRIFGRFPPLVFAMRHRPRDHDTNQEPRPRL